jgi:hypothetical protein
MANKGESKSTQNTQYDQIGTKYNTIKVLPATEPEEPSVIKALRNIEGKRCLGNIPPLPDSHKLRLVSFVPQTQIYCTAPTPTCNSLLPSLLIDMFRSRLRHRQNHPPPLPPRRLLCPRLRHLLLHDHRRALNLPIPSPKFRNARLQCP